MRWRGLFSWHCSKARSPCGLGGTDGGSRARCAPPRSSSRAGTWRLAADHLTRGTGRADLKRPTPPQSPYLPVHRSPQRIASRARDTHPAAFCRIIASGYDSRSTTATSKKSIRVREQGSPSPRSLLARGIPNRRRVLSLEGLDGLVVRAARPPRSRSGLPLHGRDLAGPAGCHRRAANPAQPTWHVRASSAGDAMSGVPAANQVVTPPDSFLYRGWPYPSGGALSPWIRGSRG